MVRIGGGRSKGCRNCRRRHVKCDERHPICERCEKGGFDCEGYTRELRFVDEVARTIRHAQKVATKQKPHSQRGSCDLTLYSFKSQGLPPNVSLEGFQDDVVVSFLLSKLFAGMTIVSTPWIQTLAEDVTSTTSQNSILALSKVYFGRMHRQQNLTNQGSVLYGDALMNLNHDLQDQKKAWSLSVLRSAMALLVYEFITFSSKSGWLQHAGGVGRLIELRGPWRHQSLAERQILESSRMAIALECFVKRKRCFLEHPDWKIIPWALAPESKTPILLIHDILVDLPGLMEDAIALKRPILSPDHFFYQLQTLSSKLEAHLGELYTWRLDWELANPDACYEVANPSKSEVQDPLFPTILYFTTLTAANEITTYNAILLLILKLGYDAIGSSFMTSALSIASAPLTISQPVVSSNPLYLPGNAPNPQAIATEICRSAEYHLLDDQRSGGAFFLLFPLRIAYQAFEEGAREKQWLEALMQRVADCSGWEIGRNIGSDTAVGR